MNYNEYSKQAHETAVNHGFWKTKYSNEHFLMLVCTEIAEIIEADRKDKKANRNKFLTEYNKYPALVEEPTRFTCAFEKHIKDTVEDEFADTFIRLCDLAGELKVDFDKMLPCRYHRAFERFSMTENAFGLIKGLSKGQIAVEKRIQFGLDYLVGWAKCNGINLEWHVKQKMRFNQGRPERHGKKY